MVALRFPHGCRRSFRSAAPGVGRSCQATTSSQARTGQERIPRALGSPQGRWDSNLQPPVLESGRSRPRPLLCDSSVAQSSSSPAPASRASGDRHRVTDTSPRAIRHDVAASLDICKPGLTPQSGGPPLPGGRGSPEARRTLSSGTGLEPEPPVPPSDRTVLASPMEARAPSPGSGDPPQRRRRLLESIPRRATSIPTLQDSLRTSWGRAYDRPHCGAGQASAPRHEDRVRIAPAPRAKDSRSVVLESSGQHAVRARRRI